MKIAFAGFDQPNIAQFFRTYYSLEHVDVYGLNSEEYSVLDDYDLIFLYIITGLPTKVPLTDIAKTVKQYTDKPVFTFFDYDVTKVYGNVQDYPSVWNDTFNYSDRILHVSLLHMLPWRGIEGKCRFFPIPNNIEKTVFKPWDESNERYVAFMHHTSPSADVTFCLRLLSELGYPVKWFSGWHQTNVKANEETCKKFGLSKFKCYPRLDYDTYMRELSECYVGLDSNYNYVGWSRFVTECAQNYIPVFSNNFIAANKIANPNLMFSRTEDLKKNLKIFYSNTSFRHFYGKMANERLINFLSFEQSRIRFEEILKDFNLK